MLLNFSGVKELKETLESSKSMAVFYKFKSAKDYNSIALDAPYISVGNLKVKIFESKQFGRGKDFDLLVTNAQTNEEYVDESILIPKNASVIIRRVPGVPRMPIVTAPIPEHEEPVVKLEHQDVQSENCGFVGIDSTMKYPDDLEMDEFGGDLYAIPEKRSSESSDSVQDASLSKIEEDQKIKALIETTSLEWQRQSSDGCGPGRGFGRGMGRSRMMGNHGFGRGGVLEQKTPPEGYVCHRCKVPGHFIQHCPTNGDPSYDIKRVRPPTGIPKSMLMPAPDGSFVLNGGGVASVKPDEAAFEKELEGLFSKRSTGDLPPELRCPLCKEVMKDAVLTSKCCFKSFCDKCIRDFTVSKSVCVCGATNVLADHLVPNMTLRDTINRMSESDNSSCTTGGSAPQVYGKESHNSKSRVPSSAQSEASNGEQPGETDCKKMEARGGHEVDDGYNEFSAPNSTSERPQDLAVVKSGETHEPISVKEPALRESLTFVPEKEHPKPVNGDSANKNKMKKAQMSMNGLEMKCVAPQYFADENYMMSMAPAAYNPYWTGSYTGAVPCMGFGCGPLAFPYAGVFPQDPYFGPAHSLPFGQPHLSNPADLGMRSNVGPALMSRYEVEAGKGDLKRKREIAKSQQDRLHKQVISSGDDGSSMKLKSNTASPEHSHQRHRAEKSSPDRRSRDPELHRPLSKRKSEQHHRDHRSPSNGYHEDQKAASMSRRITSSKEKDYENSDDDRHFKRRVSRYESSPAPSRHSGEKGRDKRRRVEQLVY